MPLQTRHRSECGEISEGRGTDFVRAQRARRRSLPHGGKGHFAPISPKAAAIASSLAHADGER